jgi:hypothetical protein
MRECNTRSHTSFSFFLFLALLTRREPFSLCLSTTTGGGGGMLLVLLLPLLSRELADAADAMRGLSGSAARRTRAWHHVIINTHAHAHALHTSNCASSSAARFASASAIALTRAASSARARATMAS